MSRLDVAQRRLALLIGIGGSAVLASYLLVFVYEPEIRGALWGGIPEGAMRSFYSVNMLLAAASFFPATWLLGFSVPADAFREHVGLPFPLLFAAYAAILIPSAAWLPLTAAYLRIPSPALWWTIRVDLLAVGFGASLLAWMLIRRMGSASAAARVGAASFFFFWLQTLVLDALVWPAFFPR